MSFERAQMSMPLPRTLPRNFTFHYTDGQPRTPEPQQSSEAANEPPRLPKLKITRKRPIRSNLPSYDVNAISHDVPIPSIETTEVPAGSSFSNIDRPELIAGYLQPDAIYHRFTSPPKTPAAQVVPEFLSYGAACEWAESDSMSQGESISRPSSSCSGFSDSSSFSSLSFGDSCTSPEDDCADPFFSYSTTPLDSSANPQSNYSRAPKRKAPKHIFTEDMDRHLWLTYMRYLQDPTVTPFKMLPSVAPPLGVCTRVAREAKKTWKGTRLSSLRKGIFHKPQPLGSSLAAKSGSSTPTTCPSTNKPIGNWPRENGIARNRLRELTKSKPTLSAHYTRLVNCRTPSPFPSSRQTSLQPNSGRGTPPVQDVSTSFARDMNVSLVASTASSMQLGNPLSQLGTEDHAGASRSEESFGQSVARPSVSHQKSQSLHIGSQIDHSLSTTSNQRSLRSPFHERAQRSGRRSTSYRRNKNNGSTFGPPLDVRAPISLNRSFKRRAQNQLDNATSPHREIVLQELFGTPAEISHRRIRSRGFSLGDMSDGRHLSSLFTPPPPLQRTLETTFWQAITPQEISNSSMPQHPATIRLGSPFGGRSSNVHFNTFPRRNLTSQLFEPTTSFEDRLGNIR
ncbi:hypothetical protein EJ05DRAFT_504814 [Pseudovirgaria hyperparasitica]|uniref:Uncharacterized protein n=1 Tax=Pseudovirgaria hyperparasitica TaxID=470096 RepID=A0A6A6VVB1_9PEZI|nr:uncharacterized protein EJ05DRAFT_504814 [Pseudovirgaria hyperparasitica]KAF2753726.1 hypothetical protein EJ05DRAFT_504814 [Pseudovirgaria hyperparasitica]